MSYLLTDASFDANDLNQVPGLTVLATDPYKPPKRKVSLFDIARTDKSKVASAFYNERIITVRVGITRATRGLLETSIDTLMGLLQGLEKQLLLKQSNGNRTYTCTLNDVTVDKDGGSYIELSLIFKCSDRFGYDPAYTQLLSVAGYTSNYRSDPLNIEGSAPWQVPVITITYTALSSTGSKSVTIANGSNGQSIVISRTTWAANDVLEVDSLNKTVKVNGTEVAFTGAIPEFSKGTGYWVYSDTFTSRTLNAIIKYQKRYT